MTSRRNFIKTVLFAAVAAPTLAKATLSDRTLDIKYYVDQRLDRCNCWQIRCAFHDTDGRIYDIATLVEGEPTEADHRKFKQIAEQSIRKLLKQKGRTA